MNTAANMPILVIDDDVSVRDSLRAILQEDGWRPYEAETAAQAFSMLREHEWTAVLCDVFLGDENGFDVLRLFKEELPDTPVILMTGQGSAAGALDAASFGAYDYLLKPFRPEELLALLGSIRERSLNPRHRVIGKKGESKAHYTTDIEVIGRSESFIRVMKEVGRAAVTNLPVLITGETGTGKELVAASLHRRSPRRDKPFVAVNCSAIPAELLESELFGHVRGAFTGATANRPGLWEEAHTGTLFLDEITEMPLAFQAKLLRTLQNGEARRVGSNTTQKFDVRVISASNRDVEKEVEAGHFRQDLFYRLNSVIIHIPPLRERREDIYPLAASFAERVWSLQASPSFERETIRLLEQYPWPGNVRELENAIVRAVAYCNGTVRPEDLPERIRFPTVAEHAAESGTSNAAASSTEWLTLAEVEARYLAKVLEYTRGNKKQAARLMDVDRKTIDRMLERHKITIGSVAAVKEESNSN